jgi:hypothetical protein
MNIPARIENAALWAYATEDGAKAQVIRRLAQHYEAAVKDYESSRITREQLHETELSVLKRLTRLFRSP